MMTTTNPRKPYLFAAFFSLAVATLAVLLSPSAANAQQEMYPKKEGIEQPLHLKTVPAWITFTGETRERTEEQTALGYVSGKDRLYELVRQRGAIEMRNTTWLTFYAQFHDLHALGLPLADTASNMRDTFDLRQGYFNLHYNKSAQLMVGRKELKYGDERVVGISDWTQTSRTWDGIYLRLVQGKTAADLFSTSVVIIQPSSYDTHGAGLTFHGIEVTNTSLPGTSLQPFVLIRAYPRVKSQEGTYGSETETTFGTAWESQLPSHFDTSGTLDLQRGSYSVDSIHAGSAILRLGYVVPQVPWRVHLQGEYDYATGNSHNTTSRIRTFDQQYPSNHNAFGLVDLLGFENIKQRRANLFFEPKKNVLLLFQGESLHVANVHDSVYNGGAGTIVTAPAGGYLHDDIGAGFDASAKYIWAKSYVGNFGVGHFFPGYVMTSRSKPAPLTLIYAQITYRFKIDH